MPCDGPLACLCLPIIGDALGFLIVADDLTIGRLEDALAGIDAFDVVADGVLIIHRHPPAHHAGALGFLIGVGAGDVGRRDALSRRHKNGRGAALARLLRLSSFSNMDASVDNFNEVYKDRDAKQRNRIAQLYNKLDADGQTIYKEIGNYFKTNFEKLKI